ncbi:hypothetical protein BACOVA_02969 [Bacteroides ovatus ATCC 8483]|uniref:Uncharacterized protein n=1 Tax=Bacteroides ovatus (strain ATCC 8483 / DSM 1896 / JCM 5824 / BCRC 10623 / CCUG 4943 / NCTC 11153) TaxID=411476 RepID=A0AAN3A6T0_BACO1|nr:hypothetical protein BACOVA_02969 [Bacteroides ovatus ATCC 8483]
MHLPEAYRSLSRPSSPPRAKASAMRPCLLSFKRFILILVLTWGIASGCQYCIFEHVRFDIYF